MCPACSRYSVICNESARVKKKKNIEAYRWIVLWEMQRCRQIYIYIYIIFKKKKRKKRRKARNFRREILLVKNRARLDEEGSCVVLQFRRSRYFFFPVSLYNSPLSINRDKYPVQFNSARNM